MFILRLEFILMLCCVVFGEIIDITYNTSALTHNDNINNAITENEFEIEEHPPYRYDYVYIPEVNGWMKIHRVPVKWLDARVQCQLEGAVLASPTNDKMLTVMRNVLYNNSIGRGIFIGVHDMFSTGNFLSVEGIPLLKMPVKWGLGEPDNQKDEEHCILLSSAGSVADVNCNEVLPFICYKKNENAAFNSACGTIDNKYTFNQNTGTCYKFHNMLLTWPRAYQVCVAEGGHLADINSEEKVNVLRELFKDNYENVKWEGRVNKIVLLGFYRWSELQIWSTVHGSLLEDAGLPEWSDRRSMSNFEYGAMNLDGKLEKLWDYDEAPFICEKSPESLLNLNNIK